MRLAIISDIHGNDVSLQAVLADIEKQAVDQIICLGDVAATGPQPRACIARLRELNCPLIMGNTDEWLLNPHMTENPDEKMAQIEAIDWWCAGQLSDDERAFLKTFSQTHTITLEDDTALLAYHGSPRSNIEGIHPHTPEEAIKEMIGEQEAMFMAGGHTHNQMMRHVQQMLLINPGSVGLPFEKDAAGNYVTPPWAEYALIEYNAGRVSIDLRRVHTNEEAIITAIQESEMPHKTLLLDGRASSDQ